MVKFGGYLRISRRDSKFEEMEFRVAVQGLCILFVAFLGACEGFNVTMASIAFAGEYSYSVELNTQVSLRKLAGIIDESVDSQLGETKTSCVVKRALLVTAACCCRLLSRGLLFVCRL